MNSEGRIGVLIKWTKPVEERDYNNLQPGDFVILNHNVVCSVTDGSLIDFTGAPQAELYEWLLKSTAQRVEGIDYNIFTESIISRPTNTKDSELVNYNLWLTEYQTVRRTNEELIQVIRDKENEANTAVLNEAERNKLNMLSPALNAKLSANLPLNETEHKVYTRMQEVAEKAMINASNAASLIAIVTEGGTPDINSGWEYDNITQCGYPFA